MRACREWLSWIISIDWLSCNSLNLLLELWSDLVDVLRSHKDTCLLIGSLLESSLSALGNCGCQDIDGGGWELRDVLRHSDQHSRSSKMVTHLHKALGQLK